MRALKMLSPSLIAIALAACGGEVPNEPATDPSDQSVIEGEYAAKTGIGTKPDGWVDACADVDEVRDGDFAIRQNADMGELDGVATVDGDLTITGVTTLADLRCLREVHGDLVIQGTDTLKELHGLDNLQLVTGGVWITENAQLTSIAELASLKRVGSDIVIERNEVLQTLEGLANVGGSLRGGLVIQDNDALVSIDGFRRLDVITGGLVIAGNPSLETVSGFGSTSGLVTSLGDVILQDNDMLGRAELPLIGVDRSLNSLVVSNNPRLKQLDMHADSRVHISGDLVLRENPALRTFTGFSTVQHVFGDLRIEDNDGLPSLEGFSGLKAVAGYVVVLGNDGIADLDLTRLESVGEDLIVTRNLSLSSLAGLRSLREVSGDLDFDGNPLLSDCAMEELVTRLETGRTDARCER